MIVMLALGAGVGMMRRGRLRIAMDEAWGYGGGEYQFLLRLWFDTSTSLLPDAVRVRR